MIKSVIFAISTHKEISVVFSTTKVATMGEIFLRSIQHNKVHAKDVKAMYSIEGLTYIGGKVVCHFLVSKCLSGCLGHHHFFEWSLDIGSNGSS